MSLSTGDVMPHTNKAGEPSSPLSECPKETEPSTLTQNQAVLPSSNACDTVNSTPAKTPASQSDAMPNFSTMEDMPPSLLEHLKKMGFTAPTVPAQDKILPSTVKKRTIVNPEPAKTSAAKTSAAESDVSAHFSTITGLPSSLLERLEKIGFAAPTPIQEKAIQPALEGRDVLGSAQTGTGKTGAYGIPLIAQLLKEPHGSALVLLPTRELAVQVMQALKNFIPAGSKIPAALLIGGADMRRQCQQLRANPRIIVGTPGRINDHREQGNLKLYNTNFLVLDEVDRMLDMGFGIQLEDIIPHTSKKRQTLMFSATLPKNIQKLSAKYLNNPISISVNSNAPAPKIKQIQVKLSDAEKYPRLLEELQQQSGSVLVFVKTKRSADNLAKKLRQEDIKIGALHGDLRQSQRDRVLTSFRKEKIHVLVATDVAARGLDVPSITCVINYDMPQNPEDYIHRIGRTGRFGKEGTAISFISSADNAKWRAIVYLLDPSAKQDDNRSYKGKGKPKGRGKSSGSKWQSKEKWKGGKESKWKGKEKWQGKADKDKSDYTPHKKHGKVKIKVKTQQPWQRKKQTTRAAA